MSENQIYKDYNSALQNKNLEEELHAFDLRNKNSRDKIAFYQTMSVNKEIPNEVKYNIRARNFVNVLVTEVYNNPMKEKLEDYIFNGIYFKSNKVEETEKIILENLLIAKNFRTDDFISSLVFDTRSYPKFDILNFLWMYFAKTFGPEENFWKKEIIHPTKLILNFSSNKKYFDHLETLFGYQLDQMNNICDLILLPKSIKDNEEIQKIRKRIDKKYDNEPISKSLLKTHYKKVDAEYKTESKNVPVVGTKIFDLYNLINLNPYVPLHQKRIEDAKLFGTVVNVLSTVCVKIEYYSLPEDLLNEYPILETFIHHNEYFPVPIVYENRLKLGETVSFSLRVRPDVHYYIDKINQSSLSEYFKYLKKMDIKPIKFVPRGTLISTREYLKKFNAEKDKKTFCTLAKRDAMIKAESVKIKGLVNKNIAPCLNFNKANLFRVGRNLISRIK